MATTTILRSHNCVRDSNPNPKSKHGGRGRGRRQRRTATAPSKTALVMGQVKILKRGEALKPAMFDNHKIKSDLSSADRLGPDPEIVQKHVRVRVPDLYAGVAAPPPSCLPFPSAFVCRSVMETDLRRLLKI